MIEWTQEPEIACYSPSLENEAGREIKDDV
jgi:hypothetical protein